MSKVFGFAMAVLISVSTAKANDAEALLDAKIDLASAPALLGSKSSRIAAFQRRVEGLEKSGTRIDLAQANRRFDAMVAERSQLIDSLGARHHSVIALTQRVAAFASLLADVAR